MRAAALIIALLIAGFHPAVMAESNADLKVRAEQGDADAQYKLGASFKAHTGESDETEEALIWFGRAADQGHPAAQLALGTMHKFGYGVESSSVAAAKYYRLAADQGNVTALNRLAFMYAYGDGVEQNGAEAVRLYTLATNQGDIKSYIDLGDLYRRGNKIPKDFGKAISLFEQAIALGANPELSVRDKYEVIRAEKLLTQTRYDIAMDRSHALANQGKFAEAEPYFRQVLETRIGWMGEDDPLITTNYNNLASVLLEQDKIREAEELLLKALETRQHMGEYEDPKVGKTLNFLVDLYVREGRYTDAAQAARKAVEVHRRSLGETDEATNKSYNRLANILRLQRKYREAMQISRRIYDRALATHGPNHRNTLTLYGNIADILRLTGNPEQAAGIYRKILNSRRTQLGANHPDLAFSYRQLAGVLKDLNRFKEGEEFARMALAIEKEKPGNVNLKVAENHNLLSLNLAGQKRYGDAVPHARKAAELIRTQFGSGHPYTASAFNNLATILLRLGELPEAEKIAAEGVDTERIARSTAISGEQTQAEKEILSSGISKTTTFANYLEIASAFAAQRPDENDRLQDQAFLAAQDLVASAATQAMAEASARATAGTGALAKIIRQQQDLKRRARKVDQQYLALLSANKAKRAAVLHEDYRTIIKKISAIDTELEQKFPEYQELTSPQILKLAAVQRILKPDEGILVIVATNDHSYSFALTSNSSDWHQSQFGADAIGDRIAALRCSVDIDTCSDEDIAALEKAPLSEAELEGYQKFDLQAAYELYANLVQPVEAVFAGTDRLFITTSGMLADLPLAMLTIAPPEKDGDFADPAMLARTPWLGVKYALTKLPTVAALKFRQLKPSSTGGQTDFLGYGDPLLGPSSAKNLTTDRGASFYRSAGNTGVKLGDPDRLRSIPSLPGTSSELTAMAKLFDSELSTVKMGAQATESSLKSSNNISRARIIAFATHGLLPNTQFGMDEPGLVFTPPAKATIEDDGILTATEASRLSLNADWVILSACNTASNASGAGGGDSLSALSRAFLYSGARSLLASHWQVPDEPTAVLTVETLRLRDRHPEITRSQALQRAMQLVRTGKRADGSAIDNWNPGWAHPASWAAFSHIANSDE